MGSPPLTDSDPLAPEIVNWGGTPSLMVRRYNPRPRTRARDVEVPAQPTPRVQVQPTPRAQTKPQPQLPKTAPHRLRQLDPLPDDTLWVVDDVFTRPGRMASIYRALSSLVAVLVVLDVGALLVRSAEASSPRQAIAALNTFSPTSLLPPISLPALTSTTTPSSTAAAARKASAPHTTKARTGIPNTVTASGTWGCIIQHESGGNPRAVNPSSGAGGLFQFLPSSWILYGGTGRPQDASVQEQWRVALNAYARSGFSPWRGDGCV